MPRLTDSEAIATWERERVHAVPRRRERPGVCYICGDDMPDGPSFGDVTCGRSECREQAVRR